MSIDLSTLRLIVSLRNFTPEGTPVNIPRHPVVQSRSRAKLKSTIIIPALSTGEAESIADTINQVQEDVSTLRRRKFGIAYFSEPETRVPSNGTSVEMEKSEIFVGPLVETLRRRSFTANSNQGQHLQVQHSPSNPIYPESGVLESARTLSTKDFSNNQGSSDQRSVITSASRMSCYTRAASSISSRAPSSVSAYSARGPSSWSYIYKHSHAHMHGHSHKHGHHEVSKRVHKGSLDEAWVQREQCWPHLHTPEFTSSSFPIRQLRHVSPVAVERCRLPSKEELETEREIERAIQLGDKQCAEVIEKLLPSGRR